MKTCLDRIARPDALKAENSGESSAQPRWFTDAVSACVHAERGQVKRIALTLGVPEQAVYAAADPNTPRPLKAWWIPTIVQETHRFTVLDVLEAQVGRVAFLLPPVNPHVDEMNRELARNVSAFGTFLQENSDALADGRLEPHETRLLVGAIDSMLAGLSEYRAMVMEKSARDQR